MMITAGLALTVLGWLIQLYTSAVRKDPKINPAFICVYAAGCILLAAGSFTDGNLTSGILNTVDVILPFAVLAAVLAIKRQPR